MTGADRYVIDRNIYECNASHFLVRPLQKENISYREKQKRRHLSFLLHGLEIEQKKVLNQTRKSDMSPTRYLKSKAKLPRKVKSRPDRILEAPNIINDYYTFSIDWGYHNMLAVALDTSVYTWDTQSNKTQLLGEYPPYPYDNAYISCIAWQPRTADLAITSTCTEYVDLWQGDTESFKQKLRTHFHQVSILMVFFLTWINYSSHPLF